MKLTEENLKLFAEIHKELIAKSEVIWKKLFELEPDRYEYFCSIDNIDPDFEDDISGYFFVSGYDGSGAASVTIPIDYYINDNWLETHMRKVEERKEKVRIEKEEKLRKMEQQKEERDRLEYLRLKEKFENK